MATNGVTGVLIREIARRASLPPVQEFIVRQDCGCGSTIGPLISTATGIRVSRKEEQTNHQLFAYDVLLLLLWWLLTRFAWLVSVHRPFGFPVLLLSRLKNLKKAIDMGCPQLSMHSIRETMGVCDRKSIFREVDTSFTLSMILSLWVSLFSNWNWKVPSSFTKHF